MKSKFEGEGVTTISPKEDNKDIDVPTEDLAALYQVGNQDMAGNGEAQNDKVYNVPALESEANLYKLTQQEVGVAKNDEVFNIAESAHTEMGEGSSSEALNESTEAFLNAKAKYEELKAQIEENKYHLQFLHEMDSAQRNIQVAESVAINEDYTEERKVTTATNAANFLNNLNNRLTAELTRLNPEPSYVDLMETVTVNSELDKNPQVDIPPAESVDASNIDSEFVPMTETEPVPVTVTETTPVEETQTASAIPEAIPVVGSEIAPVPVTAETVPVLATAEKAPNTEATPEAMVALTKYQEKRAEWREYNKIFKQTEDEYKKGLADYYERRGGLEIMRTGARSLLGLEPKFPAEVAELQARYSEAKKFYALEFSKVLALRGQAHEGNADYSLKRKEMKRAMAQKFILKPAEQLLDLQAKTVQAENERSTTKKVMSLMAKHKWGIRVGTVVLAGAVGLASGGASVAFAAAGSRVVRMAAGMAGGALAGAGVNRAMQGYVETGDKRVTSAEEEAKENFDLSKLDELESELLSAQADKSTREARRTAATVAVAGVAGFGSGMMAAEIPLGAPVADYSNEGRNYPASANNENYSNEGLNYPNPIGAVEAIPGNEYVVEQGDNLWNIVKTEYADTLKDLPPAEQNRVLAELFERAKADDALLESIGLRSGDNLNLIYPGEKLELQGLGNELQEILNQSKPEVVASTPDAVVSAIPASSETVENTFVSVKPELDEIPASTSVDSLAPRPYSADGNYFALPEYRDFALGSMGGIEQITNSINRAIDTVEGKQDVFEALQGKPRVFDVLKGLTVDSLNNLAKTPGAIENFAVTNGVEENMLREWMYNFDQIKNSNLPRTGTTTFGDLFTRSVIENHVNSLFK